jgi:hypothetical protein
MSTGSHQTVRLSRGRHRSPKAGVCVMELASMLAGEPFSDRPRCACPVIAAFLRRYNDGIDDLHRRDLYRFAALSVDTRAPEAVELARGEMCRCWARAWYPELRRGRWRLLPVPWPPPDLVPSAPGAGALAALIAAKLVRRHHPAAHASALRLLERLVECGPAADPWQPPTQRAGAAASAPPLHQFRPEP